MGVLKKIAAGALAVAALGGLGFGSYKLETAFNPASKGESYLEDHGYTDVQGGDIKLFNTCGKGYLAREYTAIDQNHQKVKETVCLSPLWTHKPWIG